MTPAPRATVVAVIAALAVAYARATPTVVPAAAPATDFSAARAFDHIKRIADRPHPTGSDAHREVIAYITGQLRAMGLAPQVQAATGVGTRYPVAGHVRNILARIPGSASGGLAVLVMVHYDGVAAGPAAGDDGTGSAALLETIRALRAGPPLANDIVALFTDSEEQGLLGAAAFVREHPWAKEAGVILNFEARGVNGPSLMFETGRGNLDVARSLRRVGGARATSLSTVVYRRLPNDTDLSEMMSLDRPAMNFAFIGGVDRYHTTEDDVTHLDSGSVQHHGNQMLALTRAFASETLPRPVTPDAVFFFVPGMGTIAYSEFWSLPLAMLALVLVFAVPALRGYQRPQGWTAAMLAGSASGLAAPVAGGLAGFVFGSAIQRLHLAIGSGTPRLSGVYATALALLVASIVLALHRFVVRGRQRLTVERGVLVWWGIVSILIAFYLAGASFLFTWPLLGAIVALAASVRTKPAWAAVRWAGMAFVVAVIAPTAYLMVVMALGLDAIGGAILGVLVAMAASLVAPHVVTDASGGWRLPAGFAAAGAMVMLVGLATVRTNAKHPVGASLVYATDADSGGSWLTGYGNGPTGAAWVNAVLDAKGAADGRPAPTWMQRLTRGRRAVPVNGTSIMTGPLATMLKDSSGGGQRHVRVRIRPAPGTLGMSLQVDGGDVRRAAVDGRAISRDRYRTQPARWSLDFVAPPDSGFILTLELDAASRAELWMTARSAGLARLPGAPPDQRPPGVLAIQNGDATVVFKRLRL